MAEAAYVRLLLVQKQNALSHCKVMDIVAELMIILENFLRYSLHDV